MALALVIYDRLRHRISALALRARTPAWRYKRAAGDGPDDRGEKAAVSIDKGSGMRTKAFC